MVVYIFKNGDIEAKIPNELKLGKMTRTIEDFLKVISRANKRWLA